MSISRRKVNRRGKTRGGNNSNNSNRSLYGFSSGKDIDSNFVKRSYKSTLRKSTNKSIKSIAFEYRDLMKNALDANQRTIDSLNKRITNIRVPNEKYNQMKNNLIEIVDDFQKMQKGMIDAYLGTQPYSLDSKKPFKDNKDYLEALERVPQYQCQFKTELNDKIKSLLENINKKNNKLTLKKMLSKKPAKLKRTLSQINVLK